MGASNENQFSLLPYHQHHSQHRNENDQAEAVACTVVYSVEHPSGGHVLRQAGVAVTTGVTGQFEFAGGRVVVASTMQFSVVQGSLKPEQNCAGPVVV
jgi:hypothetical protein